MVSAPTSKLNLIHFVLYAFETLEAALFLLVLELGA